MRTSMALLEFRLTPSCFHPGPPIRDCWKAKHQLDQTSWQLNRDSLSEITIELGLVGLRIVGLFFCALRRLIME
jgi:hypothetical protein